MSLPYVLVTNLAARRCTLSSARMFLAVNKNILRKEDLHDVCCSSDVSLKV